MSKKKKENIKEKMLNNMSIEEMSKMLSRLVDDVVDNAATPPQNTEAEKNNCFTFSIKYEVSESDTKEGLTKFLFDMVQDGVSEFFKKRQHTKENLVRIAKKVKDTDKFIFCSRDDDKNYEVICKCDQQEKINLIVRLLETEEEIKSLLKVLSLINQK